MSDMDRGEGWINGVVQVALPGRMQPQPQVLMAYKSLALIFYSAKARRPGERTCPKRMQNHRAVYIQCVGVCS